MDNHLVEDNHGYFFQSDKSIAFHQSQEAKSKNTNGNPIKLASKIISSCILNSELALFGLSDGTVQLIDLFHWRVIGKISQKPSGPISSLAYSAKLSLVACGSWDRSIVLFRFCPKTKEFQFLKCISNAHTDYVQSLCFLDDEGLLLSGCYSGMLYSWNVNDDFKLVKSIQLHKRAINCILFANSNIFTASSDNSIRRMSINFVQEDQPICNSFQSNVICLGISSCKRKIYAGSADKKLLEIDLSSEKSQELLECESWITAITISPNELFVGCENGDIFELSLQDFNNIRQIKGHFDRISNLEFIIKNDILISCSLDGTVRKWSKNSNNNNTISQSLFSPEEEAELEELLD